MRELDRVARKAFITVLNRLFPVEHHTGLPFVHHSDPLFKYACGLFGKNKWADQKNLILMSKSCLRRLAPAGRRIVLGETGIYLGPFSSNLFLFIEQGRQ